MEERGKSPLSSEERTDGAPAVVQDRERQLRRGYATRNLTEGSIPRNLWLLAWPQMIENVLNVIDQLADVLWAGRLGIQSIAGLGVAQNYTGLAMTGRMGFDMAMRAIIARAVGAGDIRQANHAALQAFTLSGAYSILMMVIGVFLTEPLMRIIGVSDDVVAAGADYMRILLIGQGAVAFRMMTGAALQASGDAVTPMKATMITRIVNISLSPCLVFGLLFFPKLGLPGSATSNALAQLIGVSMNFYALFKGRSRLHITFKGYYVDLPLLWQIVRLGAPASVTAAERTVAQLMLLGIVAPFGDVVLAAYALTRRAEMITNLGNMGLGQAAGILVGQNLGAAKPDRARQTVGWGILFASLVNIGIAGILFAIPDRLLSLFNQQPELLSIASVWLRIQVISYLFMGTSMVFMQTFNTAGDTFVPMIVTLLSIWGVQQPLALILPHFWGLGQYGISWAINAAIIVRVLVYTPYFFWGPWMKKNVLGVRQPGRVPIGAKP